MKKLLFKTLMLTATIGTIQANTALKLATGFGIAAGTTAGYKSGQEIQQNLTQKEYESAACNAATLATGSALLKILGLYTNLSANVIDTSLCAPMDPAIITPSMQQLMKTGAKYFNAASYSMLSAPRFMLLTPLAMLGYTYGKMAYNSLESCMPQEIEEQAQKEFMNQRWAKIGSKFSLLPARIKASYQRIVNDTSIDRNTLIGNK